MNGEHKIGQRHRSRLALIYLRQSTAAQVREHTESTMRQYALADAAVCLGWDRSQVLVLAQRMQEAKRAAARRGELRLPLPVGYVYDIDGQIAMDPDQEIQAAVADVFRAFEATGTCCGVVKAFRDRRFPTHGQSWTGE